MNNATGEPKKLSGFFILMRSVQQHNFINIRNFYQALCVEIWYNEFMKYQEHIENALEYIEANLKADLSLASLAQAAGYSAYHFLRVFKEVTSLTPADYIRKRRLSEIAQEIIGSNRPISEIAFAYGFNSKENFTRAFKAEHHVLPSEYRAAGNSLKLYDRVSLQVSPFAVTPEIVSLEDFSLTGFWSDEDFAPNFWNKYNCKKLSKRLSAGKVCADYGVSQWNREISRLEYFIGIPAENAVGDKRGAESIFISGGVYAKFATPPTSHGNFVNTIHRTWHYIINSWLPNSGYCCLENSCQFETYVEDSRTYSEDIYIQVAQKSC